MSDLYEPQIIDWNEGLVYRMRNITIDVSRDEIEQILNGKALYFETDDGSITIHINDKGNIIVS